MLCIFCRRAWRDLSTCQMPQGTLDTFVTPVVNKDPLDVDAAMEADHQNAGYHGEDTPATLIEPSSSPPGAVAS